MKHKVSLWLVYVKLIKLNNKVRNKFAKKVIQFDLIYIYDRCSQFLLPLRKTHFYYWKIYREVMNYKELAFIFIWDKNKTL